MSVRVCLTEGAAASMQIDVTAVRTVRVALGLLLATAAPAALAGTSACLSDFQNALDDCSTTSTCFQDLSSGQSTCVDAVDTTRARCLNNCRDHAVGGRCTILRGCTSRCRQRHANGIAYCQQQFVHNLHVTCRDGLGCLTAARRSLRTCRRGHGRSGAARTAEVPPTEVSPVPEANRCSCRSTCITQIVGDCYAACRDACGSDLTARSFCQLGCRNDRCDELRGRCTMNDTSNANDFYERCCASCDNCETPDQFDAAVPAVCSPTTTSTSSSTSTSSVTTTTATTLTTTVTTSVTTSSVTTSTIRTVGQAAVAP